jgi:hypothetical protein
MKDTHPGVLPTVLPIAEFLLFVSIPLLHSSPRVASRGISICSIRILQIFFQPIIIPRPLGTWHTLPKWLRELFELFFALLLTILSHAAFG